MACANTANNYPSGAAQAANLSGVAQAARCVEYTTQNRRLAPMRLTISPERCQYKRSRASGQPKRSRASGPVCGVHNRKPPASANAANNFPNGANTSGAAQAANLSGVAQAARCVEYTTENRRLAPMRLMCSMPTYLRTN